MNNNTIFMHVSLYVNDIRNTVKFYTKFFNAEPSKVKPGYAKFELQNPGLIISFVENPDKVAANFGHLGFRVNTAEELEAQLSLAKQNGFSTEEEFNVSCCYATQDKFWVKDPSGYMWEVYLFKQDAEFNDPRYATTEHSLETKACCTPSSVSSELKSCC